MSTSSAIEWTEATWNPVAGCSLVSPGCTNCYAMRMAARLACMGQSKYLDTTRNIGGRAIWNGQINLDEASIDLPLSWKKGRLIFVNSMSDLFHETIPFEFIQRVFQVMLQTPQHNYQILTKRAERMAELSSNLPWADNIWLGVSVENQDYLWRADYLRQTPAKIKFLSLEPLLGPLTNLDLTAIDWLIVGGESGPKARPMSPSWVREIRDTAIKSKVPFYFKQWGGTNKKANGNILDDRKWEEWPVSKISSQGRLFF